MSKSLYVPIKDAQVFFAEFESMINSVRLDGGLVKIFEKSPASDVGELEFFFATIKAEDRSLVSVSILINNMLFENPEFKFLISLTTRSSFRLCGCIAIEIALRNGSLILNDNGMFDGCAVYSPEALRTILFPK